MEPAQNLIDRLDGVRSTGKGSWVAKCPAHEDRSPSLSVTEKDDGRVLLYCHAGCGAADVLTSVGLEFSDLYPPSNEARPPVRRQKHHPLSVLKAIHGDAFFTLLCAEEVAKGNPLDESTRQELAEVSGLLRRAVEMGK